jgi:cyclohexadienyl dehydratase
MRAWRFACLLLLVAVLPNPVRAQDPSSRLDEIIGRGTLRVGLTGDYRPFSILDKQTGRYSGLDVDMGNNLADALGARLEIVHTAWKNLLPDLLDQRFDIGMGGVTITLERQKAAFFSTPIMRTGKAPIARCADKANMRAFPRSTARASGSSSTRAAPTNASTGPTCERRRSSSFPTTPASSTNLRRAGPT